MSKSRVGSEFQRPEQSPGFMLWRVSNEWQRVMREALLEVDLSHVQFVLLASTIWLEDQGIKVNQTALADQTAIDKMMVSDVVKTLERKKLVTRRPDAEDGRAKVLRATDHGVRAVQAGMKEVERANRTFFSRAQLPREELVDVLRSLSTTISFQPARNQ